MLNYLTESLRRKRARRITQDYPARVDVFNLSDLGRIEFANWENPLVKPVSMNQEIVDFFRRFISPGDLAIDIGANIGDTTVPMALAAGANGLTLGFDPNPKVFKILERNAALNRERTRIVPLPFAISSRSEEFYFVSSEASFANGGLSKTKESRHGRFVHSEMVQAVDLQELLISEYREWLTKLTFIKVDAEGHDAVILEAISDLIDEHRPTVVAEVFEKDTSEGKERVFRALERPGYELHLFREFDSRSPLHPVHRPHEVANTRHTMNLCASPI